MHVRVCVFVIFGTKLLKFLVWLIWNACVLLVLVAAAAMKLKLKWNWIEKKNALNVDKGGEEKEVKLSSRKRMQVAPLSYTLFPSIPPPLWPAVHKQSAPINCLVAVPLLVAFGLFVPGQVCYRQYVVVVVVLDVVVLVVVACGVLVVYIYPANRNRKGHTASWQRRRLLLSSHSSCQFHILLFTVGNSLAQHNYILYIYIVIVIAEFVLIECQSQVDNCSAEASRGFHIAKFAHKMLTLFVSFNCNKWQIAFNCVWGVPTTTITRSISYILYRHYIIYVFNYAQAHRQLLGMQSTNEINV